MLRLVAPAGRSGNVGRVSPEPLPSFDDDPRVGRTVLTEEQLMERCRIIALSVRQFA